MVCAKLLTDEDGETKYTCLDTGRQTFGFRNGEGDMVKDVKAIKLTTALVNSGNLDEQARKSGEKLWTKEDGSTDYTAFNLFNPRVSEIMNLESDSTKFRSTVTSLMS
jgi:hypothetical protein